MHFTQSTSGTPVNQLLRHRFGVNYTPSLNWWFCWNDFNPEAIARDLDVIASLNMDHIRIMLIWPSFQPNEAWVSPAHLDRLDQLMTLAGERNLDVMATMLTGWLSGWNFKPPFENGSIYSAPRMIAAEELYFREVAKVLKPHSNFLGFDLGNELNCCWMPEDLATGDAWMDETLTLLETLCPEQVHVNGVDHAPWFSPCAFSAKALANRQKIVALHAWTLFTGAIDRGGPLGAASLKLSAGMAALARAYAGDAAKPIWIQEYGATEEWMTKDELPLYVEQTTLNAINQGVSWFTWWDSHDVDRKFHFTSLEYGLGLITADNKVKEYARAYQSLAQTYGGKPVTMPPAKETPPLPEIPTHETTWKWLLEWMD